MFDHVHGCGWVVPRNGMRFPSNWTLPSGSCHWRWCWSSSCWRARCKMPYRIFVCLVQCLSVLNCLQNIFQFASGIKKRVSYVFLSAFHTSQVLHSLTNVQFVRSTSWMLLSHMTLTTKNHWTISRFTFCVELWTIHLSIWPFRTCIRYPINHLYLKALIHLG